MELENEKNLNLGDKVINFNEKERYANFKIKNYIFILLKIKKIKKKKKMRIHLNPLNDCLISLDF